MKVTIILNGFKRQHTLKEQLEALNSQSYKVHKIVYLNHKNQSFPLDYYLFNKFDVDLIETTANYGVWCRFSIALNFQSDYICIIDDDVIPGKDFILNCVTEIQKQNGVYGILGSTFSNNSKEIGDWNLYGWKGINNNESKQVNYLYQCWFFKYETLQAFWTYPINEEFTLNRKVGEDIHLSLAANKVLGLKSYVVPHSINKKNSWGNIVEHKYGLDQWAVHLDKNNVIGMLNYLQYAIESGMEIIKE